MSVLTLLNPPVKPSRSKPEPKRSKPEPTLPKFEPIPYWVKFVHPANSPLPTPEGRGKSVPETCEYGPELPMDAIGCQPRPEARYVFVEGSGYELVQPEPERTIDRPSRAEYVSRFQAEARATRRPLPGCVLDRWGKANALVLGYAGEGSTMPRSARRAIGRYRFTLGAAYDRALIARIVHYAESHNRRAYASKQLSTTKAGAR